MLKSHALRCAIPRNISPLSGGITLYSLPGATVNTQTTYSVRVPDNITSIAAVAIGAGGGGGGCSSGATAAAGGGGGGALSYTNSIAVTPGEILTVVVPNQAGNGTTAGTNGSAGLAAELRRSATVLLSALGGAGSLGRTGTTAGAGAVGGAAASGVGDVRFSGGSGGAGNASTDNGGGGGGAAGYAGNGGTGGNTNGSGTAGAGGGGGGGSSYTNSILGGSGGGTLWYGLGPNGAGGVSDPVQTLRDGNLGSSLGGSESILITPTVGAATENNVGMPGGGGAGAPSAGTTAYNGMRGAGGAVRLLWGNSYDFGTGRGTAYNRLYVRGYTNSNTNTILMPTVEAGDTVVIIDYAENTSGAPTQVTPSGFTMRLNTASGTRRLTTYTKHIFSSAESGTALTCTNGSASNAKIAIVISGTSGASYSPRGTDTVGNGAVGSPTAYNFNYIESNVDGFASGVAVGFLFFNSTVAINPDVHMGYAGALTIPGPNNFTYVKVLPYTQSTNTINALLETANLGINTYNFWTMDFF